MNIKGIAIRSVAVLAVVVAGVVWVGCNGEDNPGGGGGGDGGGGNGIGVVPPESVIHGTFVDERDGAVYETITLEMSLSKNGATYEAAKTGAVVRWTWLARNLNYATDASWCYDDDPANCAIYGRLYTWEAAKSACASLGGGWRLPTREDWNNLVEAVGGVRMYPSGDRYSYYNAGTKLKATSGWNNNGNGTDDYGFSAVPGGYRYFGVDGFVNAGVNGIWWSATEGDAGYAFYRYMGDGNDRVGENAGGVRYGYSARCVED